MMGTSNGSCILLAETTMPNPYIPQEILDYIVDLLHDKPETLKRCCLVSKSWVPCARKHLFADIQFRTEDDLRSWKKTFLNSANSPAYYTRTLFIDSPRAVTAADAEEGGWIRAFSGISSLDVDNGAWYLNLAPFYNFSSTLKSLRLCPIAFPCPELFDLVCSSPLLEDLTITGRDESSGNGYCYEPQTAVPPTSPPLTGSLGLNIFGGMGNTARRLLDLPNGLHFRKLAFSWHCKEDLPWIMELIVRCSDTLECLDVMCRLPSTSISISRWSCGLPSISSRVEGGFDRPLEGERTQRCEFSAGITKRRMDHRGTPNRHARTSRSSTNLNPCVIPPDRLRYRCQRQAKYWRCDL